MKLHDLESRRRNYLKSNLSQIGRLKAGECGVGTKIMELLSITVKGTLEQN